jgi:hypothetical protein
MGEFERGLTTVLVLWGVLFLLGYKAISTGAHPCDKSGSQGDPAAGPLC